jgi:phosphomevalonate kinase
MRQLKPFNTGLHGIEKHAVQTLKRYVYSKGIIMNLKSSWSNLSWPKKIGIGVIVASAFYGWKIYERNTKAEEFKVELISMCNGQNECVTAVNAHAIDCFKEHYKIGSKRRRTGLKGDEFITCINSQAGEEFFSVK